MLFRCPLDGLAVSHSSLVFYRTLIKAIDTGVALGAWVAGGTTGGHVNPVVCPCHASLF
jgi:glycerol uptake facilitator-like aquaporin